MLIIYQQVNKIKPFLHAINFSLSDVLKKVYFSFSLSLFHSIFICITMYVPLEPLNLITAVKAYNDSQHQTCNLLIQT